MDPVPVDDEALATSIAFALKKHRKILPLQPHDDEAHHQAALRIVEQLRLSGIQTWRKAAGIDLTSVPRVPSDSAS